MISRLPSNLNPHLSFRLLKVYANSGDLLRARHLFDKIPEPNVYSWTILIGAYAKQCRPNEALELYDEFRSRNYIPDRPVLLSAAKACGISGNLVKSREIHEDAIKFGCHLDTFLGNALVDMYGKCKCCDGAVKVFRDLPIKDVVSWTSLLSCYVNCGFFKEALVGFREMGNKGLRANSMTVSSVLPACSEMRDLSSGRQIHGYVVTNGMTENVFIASALVNMYASCSSMRNAQLVFYSMPFRDTVSWNSILTAYFTNGECEKALSLFTRMRMERVKLNHDSWNAVIAGCMQSEQEKRALEMFMEMQKSGLLPNQITITSILPGCTNLERLRAGKEIHGFIFRNWISGDITTTTALIDMYAKCGKLENARHVFNRMPAKDTVAWNTMIIANSMHGDGEEALSLFNHMIKSGCKANSVTFTGVLSGCSHSQLVDHGLSVFNSMSRDHSVEPDADHYACMVDLFSRAGRMEEAYKFIKKMPMKPTASAWGSLLAGCRVYKNVDLARLVAKQLFEIEPENPGNYVMLSNILECAKMWSEASEIRKRMRDKGLSKEPGCSWIRVKNKVYTFVVGDKQNEQSNQIYKFLSEVSYKMKVAGCLPDTDFVLQDLDQEEKEQVLCNHSEKLAVAFGILNWGGESSIQVFKNLRICGDCHNVIKFMAKIVGIRIIIRDSLRFHHFDNGSCSCRDFW